MKWNGAELFAWLLNFCNSCSGNSWFEKSNTDWSFIDVVLLIWDICGPATSTGLSPLSSDSSSSWWRVPCPLPEIGALERFMSGDDTRHHFLLALSSIHLRRVSIDWRWLWKSRGTMGQDGTIYWGNQADPISLWRILHWSCPPISSIIRSYIDSSTAQFIGWFGTPTIIDFLLYRLRYTGQ